MCVEHGKAAEDKARKRRLISDGVDNHDNPGFVAGCFTIVQVKAGCVIPF